MRWADPAFAVDRRIRACTPAPGRVDHVPRRPGQARPGHGRSPDGPAAAAGRAAGRARPGAGRHGAPTRSRWARCGRPGRRPMPAPSTGPAALRLEPGERLGMTGRRARPSRTVQHSTRPAGEPASGRRGRGGPRGRSAAQPVDPARRAAYEALAAVHRDDAYANLVLPRLLRENRPERPGRRVRHRADLRHAAQPRASSTRSSPRPPAGRWTASTRRPATPCGSGAYQLLHTRVPRARGGRDHRRPGPRRWRPGATGFANAVLRRVAERDLRRVAGAARARPTRPIRSATWRWCTPIRSGSCGPSPTRSAATSDGDRARRWSPTTSARRCTCAPGPGRIDRGGAGRRGRRRSSGAFSPYAVYLPDGAPGDLRGDAATGGRTCRTRAPSWSRSRLARTRPLGRPRTSAGSTCAPARAARPACSARSPRGAAARVTAVEVAPHRARPGASRRSPGCRSTWSAPTAATSVRHEALPEAGFDRVLVDAPCTGLGSLRRRPESRWRRQPSRPAAADPAAAGAARRGAAGGPARRGGRLRHLLAAPGRDPGQR